MTGINWEAIVAAIRERDRNQCMNCPREGDVTLDVHHIVPRGQAGSNQLSNQIILCRQCHDAAHGKTMAPRIKWYTNGQMDSDEFEVYREVFNSMSLVRFDGDEQCWYIPLADAKRLIEPDDESADAETEKPDTGLAAYM